MSDDKPKGNQSSLGENGRPKTIQDILLAIMNFLEGSMKFIKSCMPDPKLKLCFRFDGKSYEEGAQPLNQLIKSYKTYFGELLSLDSKIKFGLSSQVDTEKMNELIIGIANGFCKFLSIDSINYQESKPEEIKIFLKKLSLTLSSWGVQLVEESRFPFTKKHKIIKTLTTYHEIKLDDLYKEDAKSDIVKDFDYSKFESLFIACKNFVNMVSTTQAFDATEKTLDAYTDIEDSSDRKKAKKDLHEMRLRLEEEKQAFDKKKQAFDNDMTPQFPLFSTLSSFDRESFDFSEYGYESGDKKHKVDIKNSQKNSDKQEAKEYIQMNSESEQNSLINSDKQEEKSKQDDGDDEDNLKLLQNTFYDLIKKSVKLASPHCDEENFDTFESEHKRLFFLMREESNSYEFSPGRANLFKKILLPLYHPDKLQDSAQKEKKEKIFACLLKLINSALDENMTYDDRQFSMAYLDLEYSKMLSTLNKKDRIRLENKCPDPTAAYRDKASFNMNTVTNINNQINVSKKKLLAILPPKSCSISSSDLTSSKTPTFDENDRLTKNRKVKREQSFQDEEVVAHFK